ncbi:GNAT family N-acetyltransferase, partial [Vibrio sp. 1180_3]|nr:GNAT family N-acetyltransferase [Vibrio sp. 1180_3]MDF9401877.1 GNAT family N-acetyltransferase [Vibrio sp. 1180_3]
MKIVEADKIHLETVAQLFDLYRQFYGQESDLAQASRFIEER